MTDIVLSNANGDIGILSARENGRIEFISVNPFGEGTLEHHIDSLATSSNLLGVDPELGLKTVVSSAKKKDSSLVAAAPSQTSKPYKETSPYSITTDEDDNQVLGLVFIDPTGHVFVRENGEWVDPAEDDDRFYNNPFYFVSENAVELFDKLVQDGGTPVSDDFAEVTVV